MSDIQPTQSPVILVTGATGTVGRQVAAALAHAGARVRAAVRNPADADDLRQAGAEVVAFDFSDTASVRAAVDGVGRIFLLTPFVQDSRPLVAAVVSAAKEAGVKTIVRMSALGADPNSDFALAADHGQAETLVKDSGLGWTVLQPTFFMDNVVTYGGATIAAEGALYGAAGEGRAAYVSTADIAEVAAAILQSPGEHRGQTYVITGAKAFADDEVATAVSDALGKPVRSIALTPEQQREGLLGMGTPGWMVDALVGLEGVKRNGWAAATTSVIADVLGRAPESLPAFLQRNRARLAP